MAQVVRVPVKQLREEDVEGFGEVIRDLDDVRPVIREGEMVRERMEMERRDDGLYFTNHAIGDEGVVATVVDGAARVSFVNYHGDARRSSVPTAYPPSSCWPSRRTARGRRTSWRSTSMARSG